MLMDKSIAKTNGGDTWGYCCASISQTMLIGEVVGRWSQPGDLIALNGELGVGKTQFVRGMTRGLGIDEACVSSPTFVFVQQYVHASGSPILQHVDAYRLESGTPDDWDSIGWDTDQFDGAITVVEWANRLAERLCEDRLEVYLEHVDQTHRFVTITACGSWRKRMSDLREELFVVGEAIDVKQDHVHSLNVCPICQGQTVLNHPSFPFCSERCRTIDLGRWANGDYVISRAIEHSDLDEE